jgi:hypothetical protein
LAIAPATFSTWQGISIFTLYFRFLAGLSSASIERDKFLDSLLAVIIWSIWLFRNNIIFKNIWLVQVISFYFFALHIFTIWTCTSFSVMDEGQNAASGGTIFAQVSTLLGATSFTG